MKKYSIILLLTSCLLSQATSSKIIIVGAGASGIAAATRLIEKNITDFIFLEAEERLGGRIHSVFMLDGEEGGSVDLGGEYVGGEEGNVVYELAKDSLKHFDKKKMIKSYYSDGTLVDAKLAHDVATFNNNLKKEYEGKEPIAVSDAFNKKFNDVVLKNYAKEPTKEKQASDFTGTCESAFIRRQGAFDWSKILLNDHFKICKGDQELNWGGLGFKQFLDLLMTKFGDEHRLRLFPIYHYNTVEKIDWGSEGKVKLQTKEGQKHEADYVIFTPSVGVLKEKHEKLFEPKLPDNKVDAIKNTGFDATMKVVLQYPQKWWSDDLFQFEFVWNKEDEKKLSEEYKTGPKKNGKSWLNSFYRLFTAPGLPNTLIGWFTGPLVPEIEKLNSNEIKEGVNFVIRKFLGKNFNVTDPAIVIPTNWYSNPNFRGVTSYETLATANRKPQVQKDLAAPLLNKNNIPKVFFAGEHTHETHFGTVHGAVESGYRAAEELAAHINKIN